MEARTGQPGSVGWRPAAMRPERAASAATGGRGSTCKRPTTCMQRRSRKGIASNGRPHQGSPSRAWTAGP